LTIDRIPGATVHLLVAHRRKWPQSYHAEVDHPGPPESHARVGRALSPEEAAHYAALRKRVRDEMADRMQRTRELMRHPRPLTDSEREVMRNAIKPVLRDLEVSGAIVPEVRYEAHDVEGRDGREGVHAWITLADGTAGRDVWIPTEEASFAGQVWWLADQLKEWEIDELWRACRSATWPECPVHPDSHPLQPDVEGEDNAVWRCPRSGQIICPIGALGSYA
jgi:hypothetical protein